VDRNRVSSTEVKVSRPVDLAALETKWRDLETRADPSFFQTWTWTGCLIGERFPNPVLVEAREAGRTVALALFNRRGRALYLGESGHPAMDSIYIEFNGVLAETGAEARLAELCLVAARTAFSASIASRFMGQPRLVLAGIDAMTAASAEAAGVVHYRRSHFAPWVDITRSADRFLDGLSANARQQLRRSERAYAETGAISVERATTLSRARDFLGELARLHQASWQARGKPGAFANPFFVRFHHALIEHGLPRGEIELSRMAAGSQLIGVLYNFCHKQRILAYQSGFDYAAAGRHAKPGMTSHLHAIREAIRLGATRYDFLAGDDRYKRSFANQSETLHWIEVDSPGSPRRLLRKAFGRLARADRSETLLARSCRENVPESRATARFATMGKD
jgi:CelD/BcsL family acetyltransferase involved in cellulose biosynthesis